MKYSEKKMNSLNSLNSLTKGERGPTVKLCRESWDPTFKFWRGSWGPTFKLQGGSRVSGSWSHFYTMSVYYTMPVYSPKLSNFVYLCWQIINPSSRTLKSYTTTFNTTSNVKASRYILCIAKSSFKIHTVMPSTCLIFVCKWSLFKKRWRDREEDLNQFGFVKRNWFFLIYT